MNTVQFVPNSAVIGGGNDSGLAGHIEIETIKLLLIF